MLGVILTVFERGPVSMAFSWIMLLISPLLLIQTNFLLVLVATFLGYISHGPGDAITSEGWKPVKVFGWEINLKLPFAMNAGGGTETFIVYPLLMVAIIAIVYLDADFWKLKLLKEGYDLLMVYKSLI